jgi:hypothetical protein
MISIHGRGVHKALYGTLSTSSRAENACERHYYKLRHPFAKKKQFCRRILDYPTYLVIDRGANPSVVPEKSDSREQAIDSFMLMTIKDTQRLLKYWNGARVGMLYKKISRFGRCLSGKNPLVLHLPQFEPIMLRRTSLPNRNYSHIRTAERPFWQLWLDERHQWELPFFAHFQTESSRVRHRPFLGYILQLTN